MEYQPGTFTPLTQATQTSLRAAPQEVIDERFRAIITDLTGAPAELVTPDETLAGHQQRTLWGNALWHPSGEKTPLRFPGEYADPDTGLHYNNQRYYDPASGAYLSPDPLGVSPAPNPAPTSTTPRPHPPARPSRRRRVQWGSANPGAVDRVGDFTNKRLLSNITRNMPKESAYAYQAIQGMLDLTVSEFNNFSDYTCRTAIHGGGKPEGAIEGVRPGGELVHLDPKSGYLGIRSSVA